MKALAAVVIASLALLAASPSARAQDKPPVALQKVAPQKVAPPSQAQLEEWVRQLDSDSFETRQQAQEHLSAAGGIAGPVVRGALGGNSLEASMRALQVLIRIGLSDNIDDQEASRAILDEIVARGEGVAALQAKAAIDKMNQRRNETAVAELEKLGVVISRPNFVIVGGMGIESVVAVQIGPDWKGRDQDLRWLKWLSDVNRMVIVGDAFGDQQMAPIAAMPNLKSLYLYRTKVTDKGLQKLAAQQGLDELGLFYSPFSDAATAQLKQFPKLTKLTLYGTKITPAAKQELQLAMHLEKVDYRRGAFLGIGCESRDGDCFITTIFAKSPAEKAGLRVRDTLVRIAGKPTPNFESLTEIIASKTAGDKIEIELTRNDIDDTGLAVNKPFKLQATLEEWPVDIFVNGNPRR